MKFTLELDDACLPRFADRLTGPQLIADLQANPAWFVAAADSIVVNGSFGQFTEVRG